MGDRNRKETIAITGMACRLPKAENRDRFWNNLCNRKDAITPIPNDRWSCDYFADPAGIEPGRTVSEWGGFLKQIETFDASFFGFAPREANHLDPQQRLLLELTWEALEESGKKVEEFRSSQTGVFIGAFTADYLLKELSESNLQEVDIHTNTGVASAMLSNRLSHYFDFHGPGVTVDTACSSSLVAVHLACNAILNGDCDMAVAGGVSVLLIPQYFVSESKGGFLSVDGRCKAFDHRANGYVRSEGAGVALLQPLSVALEQGDPIHAIIRGSGVNSDGQTPGITVPSKRAQLELLRQVYKRAGVTPESIGYIEAHGTGTPVGDPIEAAALGEFFFSGRTEATPCLVGSVKTNIGHLEAASGMAGLIKTIMILKTKTVPPNLHLERINPAIPWKEYRLKIPQTVEPWPADKPVAIAGVNSFGFGGTNAHVILQEAPTAQKQPESKTKRSLPLLLPISAKSKPALLDRIGQFRELLQQNSNSSDEALENLCYTASVRRDHHPFRTGVVATDQESMAKALNSLSGSLSQATEQETKTGGIVFLYTGMGSQWWAMGRRLSRTSALFQQVLERCDREFAKYADWSLLEEMNRDEADSNMEESWLAQPANFALQIALTALWRDWGIQPDWIVGHSFGEVAAFYEAGVLSFEDAVKICFHRGRLLQQASGKGTLLTVALSRKEAEAVIANMADRVSIAAINSPGSVTLSGETSALETIARQMQRENRFHRFLRVRVPYHSHYLDPIKREFLQAIQGVTAKERTVPLFSTVTGQEVIGTEIETTHWWQNCREPVLFADAVENLLRLKAGHFLEIGPHPVLSASIEETAAAMQTVVTCTASLNRNVEDEAKAMLESLVSLYVAGFDVNWKALYPSGALVSLPAYPWQRKRYWSESEASLWFRLRKAEHPLLQRRMEDPVPRWESELDASTPFWLNDHQIQGRCLLPGAAYPEMALHAAAKVYGEGFYAVEQLRLHRAIVLDAKERRKLRFELNRDQAEFSVYTRDESDNNSWTIHVTGKIRLLQSNSALKIIDPETLRAGFTGKTEQIYEVFRNRGLEYGPNFRVIRWLGRKGSELLVKLRLPELITKDLSQYNIHPVLLDGSIQTLAFAANREEGVPSLPVSIRKIICFGRCESTVWVHTRITESGNDYQIADLSIYSQTGELIAIVEGVQIQSVERKSQQRLASRQLDSSLFQLNWISKERIPYPHQPENIGRWLLFADRGGLASRFAHWLLDRGETVVLLYHGNAFQRLYTEECACYQSDVASLDQLMSAEGRFSRVVHFWNLDHPLDSLSDWPLQEQESLLGCDSIVRWFQLLEPDDSKSKFWGITRQAWKVGLASTASERVVNPLQAAAWGLCRVLGHQERVHSWGGMIDLGPESAEQNDDELVRIYEEVTNSDGEDQIAYRAGKRYGCRIQPVSDLIDTVPVSFRSDQAWLITGAFGALGSLFAKWLADKGAKHLILMGRTALPDRESWHQITPEHPLYSRVQLVLELEARGVRVHVAVVDLLDSSQPALFFQQYDKAKHPPVTGVIHAAGILRDRVVEKMEPDDFRVVFESKAKSAWQLHRFFEQRPVDYFILFSSIAGWVTSAGQSNYAAANSFVDALACYRRQLGLPAMSIGWGAWNMGMAKERGLLDYFEQTGRGVITEQWGIQTMERLMGQKPWHVGVTIPDWNKLMENWPGKTNLFQELIATKAVVKQEGVQKLDFKGELALLDRSEERRALIQDRLIAIVSRIMKLPPEEIVPTKPLNRLGLESMMATQLKISIEKEMQIDLPIMDFLSGTTIEELTKKALKS